MQPPAESSNAGPGSGRLGRTPLIAHVIYRLDVGGLENGVVNLINAIPDRLHRLPQPDYAPRSRHGLALEGVYRNLLQRRLPELAGDSTHDLGVRP
jgi:hypothetical protein